MVTASTREKLLDALKLHEERLEHALTTQSAILNSITVTDAYITPGGNIALRGHNQQGETVEITRDSYLPHVLEDSYTYQVKVLESLALERQALRELRSAIARTRKLLDSPPIPAT